MSLLSVNGLTMRFGGVTAVNGVDLAVQPGQIFSVIGPNGAGKTTVFNAITGIYEPTEGTIQFQGRPLEKTLSARSVAWAAIVGLFTALFVMLAAADPDAIWKAAIRENYKPREPFPWGKAVADARRHVADLGTVAAGGFVVGLVLGVGGYLATWRRSRRSPDVITQAGIA